MESVSLKTILNSSDAQRLLVDLFVDHGRAYHSAAPTFHAGKHVSKWQDVLLEAKLVHQVKNNFYLTDLGKTIGYGLLEKENLAKRIRNNFSDCVDIPISPATIYAGKNIVDIGCGAGSYTNLASAFGAKTAVGIDIQQPLLQIAHLLRGKSKALFLASFAEHLPIAPKTADLVILRGALSYIDNNRVFSEIARIGKPGSELLITGLGPGYFVSALVGSCKSLKFVRAFYLLVVITNSLIFALSGLRLPIKIKKYFSRELVSIFHTQTRLRTLLHKHGYALSSYQSQKSYGFCSHFFARSTHQ